MVQTVKNLPAMWETWVQSLGQKDPLEKEMATHSRILTWRIPCTEEPGGLPSVGRKESDITEQLTLALLKVIKYIWKKWVPCELTDPFLSILRGLLCQFAMSISRREMWFDFFPTTLITSSSIPGPRDRGCWIGNLRRWETMILTNWWSGLVENRCWHPTSQHAVLWFISHKRLMAASSQEASFFPEEKESLSVPALLSEPVQGMLVHSSWAGVSKRKIHQKRATWLHTHEWRKVGYTRETQGKRMGAIPLFVLELNVF